MFLLRPSFKMNLESFHSFMHSSSAVVGVASAYVPIVRLSYRLMMRVVSWGVGGRPPDFLAVHPTHPIDFIEEKKAGHACSVRRSKAARTFKTKRRRGCHTSAALQRYSNPGVQSSRHSWVRSANPLKSLNAELMIIRIMLTFLFQRRDAGSRAKVGTQDDGYI